jgi:amidase
MHGSVAGDEYTAPAAAGTFLDAARAQPAGSLRIAVSRKLPVGTIARLSADQRLAWESTGRLLSELGHQVQERDPDYGLVTLEFIQTYLRAVYETVAEMPEPSQLERSTRQIAGLGRRLVSERHRDSVLAKRVRTTARISSLFDDVDVLLTPGLASTAIAAQGGYDKPAVIALDKAARFMPWFPVWNLTGQPAISIPAGFGSDGLPLSVQLVGRHGSEELLYSLAGQIEAQRPWAQSRPALAEI